VEDDDSEWMGVGLAALRAIPWGDRRQDKLAIAARAGLALVSPAGALTRKLGKPIVPRRSAYVVHGPAGLFSCPPGPSPFFRSAGKRYKPQLRSLLDELDGGVFVDVGASIGQVTVRAARRCDHVIAVEPHPLRFKHLQRNVELNRLVNVTCVWAALGPQAGHAELYDADPSLGARSLEVSTTPGPGRSHHVPVLRLDDVAGDASFVSIGVAGAAPDVLRGAPRLLRRRPTLLVEALPDEALDELRGLLHGHRVHELAAGTWLAEPRPALFVSQPPASRAQAVARDRASRLRRPAAAAERSALARAGRL
jgi:FkbM family methyltransferase